ncbi:unnamed protein product [Polarella glacialis]|uniref:Pyrrolo-quinoline quinone repeat domain-containing protein n=1 Tax=Polarella glacialis TaxID=89957 RepID=A0A813KFY1_POLGL|nr:unnamed protein product [Polarella glacialis]
MVSIVASDGKLHVVATSSGQQLWVEEHAKLDPRKPTVDSFGAKVFFWAEDGNLQAATLATGEKLWARQLGSVADTPILVGPDGSSLFLGTAQGQLLAVSTSSGEERWSSQEVGTTAQRLSADDAATDRPRLSGSSLLRKKRVAVLLTLLGFLALHRSGKLKRPKGKDEPWLVADILGEPLAALLEETLAGGAAGAKKPVASGEIGSESEPTFPADSLRTESERPAGAREWR